MTDDVARYGAASHAMQSGVAMEMEIPSRRAPTEPKYLRAGVTKALSDAGSLVRLLIDKGVISEAEYLKAIADGMEREQRSYEARLSALFGRPVTLA